VDQFSELVDSNLETLRKGIQDNREVFVSVINKTNEEVESRYNAFVDDLERVVNEVFAMQTKVDDADKSIKEESTKLNKAVADLEAHINTSIITEKSVRKAQDQQLAEEIDNLSKKVSVVTNNLNFKMSNDGTSTKTNQQALEQDVKNNKRDIDKFGVDLAQLLLDYN
jgi:archaellum component FlaC